MVVFGTLLIGLSESQDRIYMKHRMTSGQHTLCRNARKGYYENLSLSLSLSLFLFHNNVLDTADTVAI